MDSQDLPTDLKAERVGAVIVVRLAPASLLDELVVRNARQELLRLCADSRPVRLVLDFAQVKQFGSAFLAVMIDLNNKAKATAGRLALCGLNPHLLHVLEVTRLKKAFNPYDDEESAVNSFRESASESGQSEGAPTNSDQA